MPEKVFLSPEPEVKLVNLFTHPLDNAVATARTCYARNLVTPENVAQYPERRDEIAVDIFGSGHHTVFQHAHAQFAITNVSRHFIWSFLHAHPYYNSEQQSQRYVPVARGCYIVPPMPKPALVIYHETVARLFDCYERLVDSLLEPVAGAYFQRFPARAKQRGRWDGEVGRKAMELARYVLPIGTFTQLYHTVSVITVLRYQRMCQHFDVPVEQMVVVGKMVDALLAAAPELELLLPEVMPIQATSEYQIWDGAADRQKPRAYRAYFDRQLDGKTSRLVDWKVRNEELVADAVRDVLGLTPNILGNEGAIRLAIDPTVNNLIAEPMNVTTMAKITRCLAHASYTFQKKLSHSADSQAQRHRTVPGSRPILATHVDGEPDYLTPAMIETHAPSQAIYTEAMLRAWEGVAKLGAAGVSKEFSHYLLPNATAVRYKESANLLDLRHKLAMRLCYNAQEEIWRASMDEAAQIAEVNPTIGQYLLSPCGLRKLAGFAPPCPEGKRYCGVPVWKIEREAASRSI